ncbi:hypothetical protein H9Q72_001630 [Fusarium xylarioides]|uniref:Uncharacterized protein n=1 Tax=Fusarium xylarioides TaxID=221167 RepID=A0A9P7I741_9HYPO|nr:hypothetical protein H9Q70_005084 [Fusarium xylarioides]KAG5771306.1 hypothetical protein H9Q73_012924 [Fusarium xylarioides]KAG5772017.1 hypothetical protein H9Q72_001630 [Fusarium xylarioides]KAG5801411.1 hypothetical protein H9Q71_014007 [Fusarium xylarioides]KAG5811260.1 hypothetical protein H9Q74_013649 [Fusarium xylarioides]
MRFYQIAPLALWTPSLISQSGSEESQNHKPLGYSPGKDNASTQVTTHAQAVSDAVLQAAPVSPPAAVAATPKNAVPAAVTIHHHKSAAVAAQHV